MPTEEVVVSVEREIKVKALDKSEELLDSKETSQWFAPLTMISSLDQVARSNTTTKGLAVTNISARNASLKMVPRFYIKPDSVKLMLQGLFQQPL